MDQLRATECLVYGLETSSRRGARWLVKQIGALKQRTT